MGFPAGVQTVVLSGHVGLADGQAQRDTITITPSPPEVVSATYNYILDNEGIQVVPDRATGTWSARLLATDATGFAPSGWTYTVARGTRTPYSISLPAAAPAVDLADLTPVAADPGVYDLLVPASAIPAPAVTVTTETAYGAASSAGVATAYSRGDHTHGSPTAPTKSSVGLGAVDNTSDAAKPVSTATATALAAKADTASNLSDLASAATARGNLGLGNSATRTVGTTAGTVPDGADSRLSDARTPTAHASTHATGGSDPLTTVAIGALDSRGIGLLDAAFEPIPRWACSLNSLSLPSGTMRFSYFTARRTTTVTSLRVPSGATIAGATPSRVQFALYSVDGSGNLTLMSSTANDTTIFASGLNSYTRALTANQAVTAGSLYAIGILLVTAAATPTLCGMNLTSGDLSQAPRLCATLSGQATVPSSVTAASLVDSQSLAYAAAIAP